MSNKKLNPWECADLTVEERVDALMQAEESMTHEEAVEALRYMEKRMTPEELIEALRYAEKYTPIKDLIRLGLVHVQLV